MTVVFGGVGGAGVWAAGRARAVKRRAARVEKNFIGAPEMGCSIYA